ncbi:unnamed protein product [Gulo gulo]|uniref:Uncharacterized protein n=1 Tax=Gulo gulo TaxID=48420 RepID=A0A9X9MAB5_GULGU|nr:unnamed protein product [Gulo gulo]
MRDLLPAAHTLVLLAGLPSGLHRGPCSPGHSLGSLRRCRESSQELPRSPKRETDSPIQCHHLPSLHSADPRQPGLHRIAAWGRATSQALAPRKAYSGLFASGPESAPASATSFRLWRKYPNHGESSNRRGASGRLVGAVVFLPEQSRSIWGTDPEKVHLQ